MSEEPNSLKIILSKITKYFKESLNMQNRLTLDVHTHWQVAQSNHTKQNLLKSMTAEMHR